MSKRVSGAILRAFLVALLIATPSFLLPELNQENSQIVVLIGFFAAALTFFEYVSVYPGLVEFREAPPFNRLRFMSLLSVVFLLSLIMRGQYSPTGFTNFVTAIGGLIGYALDFSYSPVRLMMDMLPETATVYEISLMRAAAGLSYLAGLVSLSIYVIILRAGYWPARNSSFNVWINLPTFDPTAGGDVVSRLKRDARINILFGFALPFLLPIVLRLSSDVFGPLQMSDSQTIVWIVAGWSFLPISLFMRGIALGHVAMMIEEKRRLTYANADLDLQTG